MTTIIALQCFSRDEATLEEGSPVHLFAHRFVGSSEMLFLSGLVRATYDVYGTLYVRRALLLTLCILSKWNLKTEALSSIQYL